MDDHWDQSKSNSPFSMLSKITRVTRMKLNRDTASYEIMLRSIDRQTLVNLLRALQKKIIKTVNVNKDQNYLESSGEIHYIISSANSNSAITSQEDK